ncbi:MAG TPA: transglutaminase-like domain-containing protein, partial [Chitinophagaceae bacterium]|nr:transglutaminase-like domain-containing protein [Chitinophagaceae bacterium]
MNENQTISPLRFLAAFLFELLPTWLVAAFVIRNIETGLTMLQERWLIHSLQFGAGLCVAYVLTAIRLRFVPVFIVLCFLLYSIWHSIGRMAPGEFDAFYLGVQFQLFAFLLVIGWICGWGLARYRIFTLVLSGIFLSAGIYLLSRQDGLNTPQQLWLQLGPAILYAVYLIYTHESLQNFQAGTFRNWFRHLRRLILFLCCMLMLMAGLYRYMYPEVKSVTDQQGGNSAGDENQMLQRNKDGSVENKEKMGMEGNNHRSSNPEPLFCAHIDHFLEGTDIPNPLYLTTYHFSKFDTLTETFERDTTLPFRDEFCPDPSAIPLYSKQTDSNVLFQARGVLKRRVVETEVYKKMLSASSFLAPSTAFQVQPIAVDQEFRKEFRYAYKTRSYVSDLNSAYFIYNSQNPKLVEFQQYRFNVLRQAGSYSGTDSAFMRYYTFFPSSPVYRRLKILADSLANGRKTTLDKVLSIRDYFLRTNELGQKVFSYTDNPGVPGLPGASRIMYFLFENHKGYCAYYAGATLFLLRAMGIPSRIVTGFLTVDRSDKNSGWYWFYEDQSHGWVQVFFPGFGWIDFDTTVGNDEAQRSPAPDGTPPLQPPPPRLILKGQVLSTDTLKKQVQLLTQYVQFRGHEYKNVKDTSVLDARNASFWFDSLQVPFTRLRKGNVVMALSFREAWDRYQVESSFKRMKQQLPDVLTVDELYISDSSATRSVKPDKKNPADNPWYKNWKT